MANNILFGRDTRLFMVQGSNIWEIPVLNGFNYTQSLNSSEVALNEMTDANGNSRRGRTQFNDSQAPAEWSFDTYVRPTLLNPGASQKHTAVEAPLWANFVAKNAYAAGAWLANTVNPVSTTSMDIKFTNSNKTELGTFDLVFVNGASPTATTFDPAAGTNTATTAYGVKMYRLYDASINEVSITFDIDGIATLSWSGNAARLREYNTALVATSMIADGINQTNNFIRNRLTQATVIRKTTGTDKTYNITLTGGTITFTNNLSYLTPELLGRVNVPLGHVTGTRAVGGSFTCYVDPTALGSGELFADLSSDQTSIKQIFDLTFYVGGASGTADVPRAPGMVFSFPRANLSIPTFDTGDVISLNVDFTALPSDMGTPDEVDLIRYVGVA